MPRSAADATRFTATGPYASSNPTPAQSNTSSSTTIDPRNAPRKGSTIDISTSAPPANESPQQKVARLRAAANRAKYDQESTIDRFLVRGRRWADRAHKITVTSLVGLSAISLAAAGLSLGNMMIYNKRKKREWFGQQQAAYDTALSSARAAEAQGTLDQHPDLALVLNKEKAVTEWERQQVEKKGMLRNARDWLFGGMAKEERRGGEMMAWIAASGKAPLGIEELPQPGQGGETVLSARPVSDTTGSSVSQHIGGPLDQLAANTALSIQEQARSLLGRFRK